VSTNRKLPEDQRLDGVPHADLPGTSRARLLEQDAVKALQAELDAARARIEELERLVDTDTLTPLANRRRFIRELERVVQIGRRYGTRASVMFVDVDGLKAINDSRGHRAGDAALIHVAEILARSLRTTDVVARLGGDEFGLLLEHLDEPQARAKAEKLADAVAAEPFEFAGERLPLCISIGVTAIRTGDDAELVLARADSEMYGLRSRATAQRSDR